MRPRPRPVAAVREWKAAARMVEVLERKVRDRAADCAMAAGHRLPPIRRFVRPGPDLADRDLLPYRDRFLLRRVRLCLALGPYRRLPVLAPGR